MLTPYSQSKFVEKVLADASGKQFRVLFLVSLEAGEIKARVISATPVTPAVATRGVICLPLAAPASSASFAYTPHFSNIVSPYTDLTFFMSQPTRAPSLRL